MPGLAVDADPYQQATKAAAQGKSIDTFVDEAGQHVALGVCLL